MASTEKRCLYEVLGLNRDCLPDEIRSAYRKLALQRHPDKLIKTGIPEAEATASFQELVNAYEVLSDPRERAWYDSHRSQILFSDPKSKSSTSSAVPDLFSFFSNSVFSGFGDSGKGFFKVYADVFGKIYAQELLFARKLGLGEDAVRDAPLMGNLESPYAQVQAFYGYWLGFSTILDFCWVDEFLVSAGGNRKSRRVMEEENKKLRRKAKREYNDTVRGLAEFVKKRDKRVIDMQMKKKLEMEKKMEEEKVRKKEAERAKLERARLYEEPDWAKVDEEEIEEGLVQEEDDSSKSNTKELYCVVCSKKFKSDKQWKNHEQSKKHKEKVAELKSTYDSEEEEEEEDEEDVNGEEEEFVPGVADKHDMDELSEKFVDSVSFQEEETEANNSSSRDEAADVSDDINEDNDNEEMETLKTMMLGRKNKKKRQPKMSTYSESHVNEDNEEIDLMQYNNMRSTRRNRAAKREVTKKPNGATAKAEGKPNGATANVDGKPNGATAKVDGKPNGTTAKGEVKPNGATSKEDVVEVAEAVVSSNGLGDSHSDSPQLPDSMSETLEAAGTKSKRDPLLEKNQKVVNQRTEKKDMGKKDTSASTRNTSKGKKQKGASKATDLSCETCGEDFDSRNKLHQHLGDTGHASFKTRR